MIILIHNHSNIVNIIIDEECDISNYIGKAIVKTLFSLSKRYPKKKIGWIHHSLVQTVDFTSWSKLLKHPLELLTYEPSQKHYMSSDIEYIDFFSPLVRFNQMKENRYLTWMSSSAMGCTYTDLIQKFSLFKDINSFPFFLLVISKIGNMQGMLSYLEPQLYNRTSKNTYISPTISSLEFFTFIKTFYSMKSIIHYYLLKKSTIQKEEKKFNYLSALKAKKLTQHKIKLDDLYQNMILKSLNENASYDVIIPTLGRKKYLYDVLKDLTVQTHQPNKIIIVEQNPNIEAKTELDYLINEVWPFEIEHILIHQLGACNARNIAIKKVTATYTFFADDDIRIKPRTIENTLQIIKTYNLRATTLAVYRENETIEQKSYPIPWHTFGSGCSIVQSSYVKETFFDKALEFGYGEDADYGNSLRKKGCSITYISQNPMLHLKAPTGGFRFKFQPIWSKEKPLPKPSPTIMYNLIKNSTKKQIKGYKLFLFYKIFFNKKPFRIIHFYKKFNQQWNKSLYWAKKLKEKQK